MQAATRRRNVQNTKASNQLDLRFNAYSLNELMMSDDEISVSKPEGESDNAWPPTRDLRAPYGQKKKRLGPPITTDEKIERLNRTHQFVVDDFMVRATKECRQVSLRQMSHVHASRRWYC